MISIAVSETGIENVPLTLASGDLEVVVHNSEDRYSEPAFIRVP